MNVSENYLEVMEKFDFSWEGKGGKKRAGTGYNKVLMVSLIMILLFTSSDGLSNIFIS